MTKIIAYWFAIIGPTIFISKKSFILALTVICATSTKECNGNSDTYRNKLKELFELLERRTILYENKENTFIIDLNAKVDSQEV